MRSAWPVRNQSDSIEEKIGVGSSPRVGAGGSAIGSAGDWSGLSCPCGRPGYGWPFWPPWSFWPLSPGWPGPCWGPFGRPPSWPFCGCGGAGN